ncbi:MAG: arginine--tRNA ligase, partial [candidate division Zixibacteria bacterium]
MTEKKDKYREAFSVATAMAFQETYPDIYRQNKNADTFNPDAIYLALEKPRDPKMGRFALPVFKYLSLLKSKPNDVTQATAAELNRILSTQKESADISCDAVGGYLNARIDVSSLAEETLCKILKQGDDYGSSVIGAGKTVLIEYSSPNIAKPFGIGHLRTTVIGNSLRLIFARLGYKAIGINYPGDWGTQFGKMIVAFQKWGDDNTLKGEAVKKLLELYVRFHSEAENDDSLNDAAREAFQKLESGDREARKLWEKFKEISFAEFKRVYESLGVEFDLVIGESFFNDKMEAVIDRLTEAGLTEISRSALIVDLKDKQLPPALLKKADGATLYMTRDLAGLVWRW